MMENTLEIAISIRDDGAAAGAQPIPAAEAPPHARADVGPATQVDDPAPLAQLAEASGKRRRDGRSEHEPGVEAARLDRKVRVSPPDEADALPGLAKLDAIAAARKELGAPGIEALWRIADDRFDVLADAGMDDEPQVWEVADDKHAVVTTGVATCYALCARGKDAAGKTLLGISHVSAGPNNEEADEMAKCEIDQLVDAMTEAGAEDELQLFVVGGQLSLYVPEDASKRDEHLTDGTLHYGVRLMNAAGERLVAARIGLSETEKHPGEYELGFRKAASTGRPEAVTVYLTKNELFYVPQE
jgi:hypothetical protein